MNDGTPQPIAPDDMFRERVERARKMSPVERMTTGYQLFCQVRERMLAGIRHQFPNADRVEVERIFRERLEIARRLESVS
ncbi:MAG: hypothetical protein ACYTDT_14370 [Planctomycetota bacterium]|jgi:hypothetical protein